MLTSELDFDLPDALIAQQPASPRDSSRLMVVDAATGEIKRRVFRDLPKFLKPRDALVLNETKVMPARLEVVRPGGGSAEFLFLRELPSGDWEALARPGKRLKPGMTLTSAGGEFSVVKKLEGGRFIVRGDVRRTLELHGHMPLPPYIRSTDEAEAAYQTVYAKNPGSAAAPTAGLHFTPETLERARRAGADVARVTLHVGVGTFLPVRHERLEEHTMHEEFYSVPGEVAETISNAGRTLAVGTTVARTLESRAQSGLDEGESGIFIYPGYEWRAVDAMVTNFHLPRSTLLAMIMSFAGVDLVREAYRVAVEERYRFYSFGDAMLILNGGRSLH